MDEAEAPVDACAGGRRWQRLAILSWLLVALSMIVGLAAWSLLKARWRRDAIVKLKASGRVQTAPSAAAARRWPFSMLGEPPSGSSASVSRGPR